MPSASPPPQTKLGREHLLYCFDVLYAKLNERDVPSDSNLPFANEKFPLFVTWNTISASSGTSRLRGCIGTFEPLELSQGLEEYTIISAFRDHRFSPITMKELPRLECAISLLTQFEECNDYLDWQLGTHGIYIDFDPSTSSAATNDRRRAGQNGVKRGVYSATYLPDVAPAQRWTKQEAVESAIQKSGYRGKITNELLDQIHVRRYQSEKASLTYTEWKAARESSK